MTLADVVVYCAGNTEFVAQFNRLTGHRMGMARTPIEAMIDQAAGYDQDIAAFPEFVEFVRFAVWEPLPRGIGI